MSDNKLKIQPVVYRLPKSQQIANRPEPKTVAGVVKNVKPIARLNSREAKNVEPIIIVADITFGVVDMPRKNSGVSKRNIKNGRAQKNELRNRKYSFKTLKKMNLAELVEEYEYEQAIAEVPHCVCRLFNMLQMHDLARVYSWRKKQKNDIIAESLRNFTEMYYEVLEDEMVENYKIALGLIPPYDPVIKIDVRDAARWENMIDMVQEYENAEVKPEDYTEIWKDTYSSTGAPIDWFQKQQNAIYADYLSSHEEIEQHNAQILQQMIQHYSIIDTVKRAEDMYEEPKPMPRLQKRGHQEMFYLDAKTATPQQLRAIVNSFNNQK